jgi:uncharacterized membrane protein (Fun14 family)
MDMINQTQDGINLFNVFSTLGFSLIAGYAIGYALKKAFKIALFFGGIFLLGVGMLAYSGIITADFHGMEIAYNGIASAAATTGNAYLNWLIHQLPTAAPASVGLLAAFRRA